ncbi:heat shock factor protein 2 isoform X2 [Ambystoma mexicanum]|uniref:heat shock factor protein 2 isoform X2 n=1 Tax=Ambystoma mexicanum TaxID=8296 RepID=UPI0037E70197
MVHGQRNTKSVLLYTIWTLGLGLEQRKVAYHKLLTRISLRIRGFFESSDGQQNGESFMVLDEQRFSKEILPKYFKHNNMASFIRQLNMYGFRKVLHLESCVVKLEHDEPIEFQHPFFRHGHEHMLGHIKRKVASTKGEEPKITPEDISQILTNAHKVQARHETFESKLLALQRENESLWREVGELRAKHSQQQQVIRKIVQFIVTLVQNNRLVNLKRKRTLLLNANVPPQPNVLPQLVKEGDDTSQESIQTAKGLKRRGQLSEDIIIYDVTDDLVVEGEEETVNIHSTLKRSEHSSTDMSSPSHVPEIVLVEDDEEYVDGIVIQDDELECEDNLIPASDETSPLLPGETELDSSLSSLTSEDPVTMMDSILNQNAVESGAVSQILNHLGKAELVDYLDKMDCSLDDIQAMLSGKQFSIDPDLLVDLFTSSVQMNPADFRNSPKTETKVLESAKSKGVKPVAQNAERSNQKSEKQLVQYTKHPLLSELLEPSTGAVPEPIMDTQPTQSKLVRLEPLTEEQASEATLFYLCKLEHSPLDNDMAILAD